MAGASAHVVFYLLCHFECKTYIQYVRSGGLDSGCYLAKEATAIAHTQKAKKYDSDQQTGPKSFMCKTNDSMNVNRYLCGRGQQTDECCNDDRSSMPSVMQLDL